MVFVMIFVSFDMVLGAYLLGNMTALIVKGSKTEKFRDKMTTLITFMRKHQLERDIRVQLKSHLRLQYDSHFVEDGVVRELPLSIRAKVARSMYLSCIQRVLLFQNCSSEFMIQIARQVQEEYFLPGEVIIEQGAAADQIYFVASGTLIEEELVSSTDDSEKLMSNLEAECVFGEVSVLCGIPQPYTVRVTELCRLLRIDKDSFFNIMEIYFTDGRQVLNNLLKLKSDDRIRQHETDISFLISEKEMELSMKVNNAAYHGKTYHLKSLIKSGADPNWADYDGRTPLHLASAKGHVDIVNFLLRQGVDINVEDNFGNTPLIEAMMGSHIHVVRILRNAGAEFMEPHTGEHLQKGVLKGNLDFIKNLLENGANPNSTDHDGRTPLHISTSLGMTLMSKLLIKHGASLYAEDRLGITPIDEIRRFDRDVSKDLLQIAAKHAKGDALSGKVASRGDHNYSPKENWEIVYGEVDTNTKTVEFQDEEQHNKCQDSQTPKKSTKRAKCQDTLFELDRRCTVFACFPRMLQEEKVLGLVLRIPDTIDELLCLASQHFGCTYNCVVNEDMGEVLDTKLIRDSEKVFVIN